MSTVERFSGDLTIQTAAEQKARLVGLLEEHDQLSLDLAELTELDTAGLQILLLLRREAEQTGKSLELTGHPEPVRELFALANLDDQVRSASDPL